jgi:hypothetical protein
LHDPAVARALEHHPVLHLLHLEQLFGVDDHPRGVDQPGQLDLPPLDRPGLERLRLGQVLDVADEQPVLLRDPLAGEQANRRREDERRL